MCTLVYANIKFWDDQKKGLKDAYSLNTPEDSINLYKT